MKNSLAIVMIVSVMGITLPRDSSSLVSAFSQRRPSTASFAFEALATAALGHLKPLQPTVSADVDRLVGGDAAASGLPPEDIMSQAWTDFWVKEALPSTLGAGMIDAATTFWEEFFTELARTRPGSKILDVGTGRMIVPLVGLAVAEAQHVHMEFHALDYAAIDVDGISGARDVHFRQSPFEATGYPPETFDVVTGMHAIEYGRSAPAVWAELNRITKPGARGAFLIHHADSVLARNARANVDQLTWLRDNDVFEIFRRWLLERERPENLDALRAVNKELDARLRIPGTEGSALLNAARLMRMTTDMALLSGLAEAIQFFDLQIGHMAVSANLWTALADHAARWGDTEEAALRQMIESHGFRIHTLEHFFWGTFLVGWKLLVEKSVPPTQTNVLHHQA